MTDVATRSRVLDIPAKFTITKDNGAEGSSRLRVTWCYGEELKQYLIGHGIVNAQVLITTIRGQWSDDDEDRYFSPEAKRFVVPLIRGEAFLSFNRSGDYYCFATIVWDTLKESDKLIRMIAEERERYGRGYAHSILVNNSDFEDDLDLQTKRLFHTDRSNVIEHSVGTDDFQKPPRPFVTHYLAKLGMKRRYDRCKQFWTLVALLLISPLVIGWSMLVRVAFLAFKAFIGANNTNYACILHPFSGTIFDAWSEFSYSHWFVQPRNGNRYGPYKAKKIWWWVLNPPVITVAVLLWLLIFRSALWLVAILQIAGMLAVMAVLLLAVLWIRYELQVRSERRQKTVATRRLDPRQIAAIEQLACGDNARPTSLNTKFLSLGQRIWLFGARKKARDCRPFEETTD